MLCKVDNYMSAVNGHIDVTTDPDSFVSFRTRRKLENCNNFENKHNIPNLLPKNS